MEPASCPSLTRGVYAYDFGDTAGMTPLMKMHTLGHDFIPDPSMPGGLRYHGMAPLISHIYELGMHGGHRHPQLECFGAAMQFVRSEGILPAPEPTHAIAAAIREALACKESGEEKVILTALCGHGHFDLAGLRLLPERPDGGRGGHRGPVRGRARHGAGGGLSRPVGPEGRAEGDRSARGRVHGLAELGQAGGPPEVGRRRQPRWPG